MHPWILWPKHRDMISWIKRQRLINMWYYIIILVVVEVAVNYIIIIISYIIQDNVCNHMYTDREYSPHLRRIGFKVMMLKPKKRKIIKIIICMLWKKPHSFYSQSHNFPILGHTSSLQGDLMWHFYPQSKATSKILTTSHLASAYIQKFSLLKFFLISILTFTVMLHIDYNVWQMIHIFWFICFF